MSLHPVLVFPPAFPAVRIRPESLSGLNTCNTCSAYGRRPIGLYSTHPTSLSAISFGPHTADRGLQPDPRSHGLKESATLFFEGRASWPPSHLHTLSFKLSGHSAI